MYNPFCISGIVKEIISLTLAVIFQSSDISVINMLGLLICMTGITLHVVRKAASGKHSEKNTVLFGNFYQHGGGVPNSQNFCYFNHSPKYPLKTT